MIEFFRRWLGKGADGQVGSPTGKTGNQLTADDFAGSSSLLATKGGPEFADYCVSQGSCEIQGAVLEKFRAVLATYPVADEEEYDHFAVVVRDRLIAHGLLAKGDPQRYQYKIAQWAPLMADHAE
jgi:hypothetical protein